MVPDSYLGAVTVIIDRLECIEIRNQEKALKESNRGPDRPTGLWNAAQPSATDGSKASRILWRSRQLES